ncbi:MAG TPA: ATP-binding protein [Syntrophorhabdaceae bacterium]|nr:ATP-binding protein [Syntrophorhabdaceae bacterium]HPU29063.1 ATP-binding protein [Syntrophorhabdaceae bacterium]
MDIYSIPPLFSAIVLFLLFLMGIFKAKASALNLLFSLICLVGCLLNIDKTILTVIKDGETALKISRIDHIFLVFIIPLYLHFTILATGYKKWHVVVKIFYIIAFFLIPLTQSRLYLTHAKHFFFGYFAQSGPLFLIFGFFSTLSVAISICLFIKNLRENRVAERRTRIKYILLSFGLAAFVNHFDVIIMNGYELYPLGNFVFIPMSLFGYAVYKHDIMEWRIFLNKGLVFFILFFISTGFFIGTSSILERLFFYPLKSSTPYVIAMAITFLVIHFSKEKIQQFLMNVLQERLLKIRESIKDLSFEIMQLHNIQDIKNTIIKRLTEAFSLERCEIRMVPNLYGFESVNVITEKDPLWQEGFRLLIPINSKTHPGYILLGQRGDMGLYTKEDIEILSMLANHVGLALDNAEAYKKIHDFSASLERLVEERTKALIQSESLAAVGRLAAGVAHELNNPIASVMSTLEYYIDHTKEDDEIHGDLIFSLNELKRARDIVRSLLDASRQKEEVKVLMDIHNPIEDALKILYNQYKNKKIRIEKVFNAEPGFIMGIPSRLCQVFINLIKNAIDAIGDKEGLIVIETSNINHEFIKCSIKDNGEGIESHIIKDIFKPFFTTKPQGKGIGLGLFIVYEIVTEHNGTIEVESEKGKGSTFTLKFRATYQ